MEGWLLLDEWNGFEFYNGEDIPAEAWFPESFYLKKDERVNEFNIPMPNYKSVLTVLYYWGWGKKVKVEIKVEDRRIDETEGRLNL